MDQAAGWVARALPGDGCRRNGARDLIDPALGAGDAVLRELGKRLSNITREGELIARVGGEEFAWILNAEGPAAFAAAERARHAVAQTSFPYAHAVTISVGLCDLTVADDADELYDGADQALYRAKGQGRDRTCQSVPGLMSCEPR